MSTVALDNSQPDVIVRETMNTSRAVDLFLGDISRRGYSERTRSTYSRILDKLCDRLPLDSDVSKVTTDDLRRFLDTMSGRKKRGKGTYSRGTQAHTEAVLSSFFGWLYHEQKIVRNPMDRLPRTRRIPAQDLDVVTVSADDVRKLMKAATTWPERLAIGLLVYTGARRRAVARLKLADYDRTRGRLRFREKGGKTIWKPVPTELATLLDAAIAAGVYEDQDYLVPPRHYLSAEERDDRIVWKLVKDVAGRVGVNASPHPLRRAFAVGFLSTHPGEIKTLQLLLGHSSLATTERYVQGMEKELAMERVRPMSWDAGDLPELPPPARHGDVQKYWGGCRCDQCRRANADYELARRGALS